MISLLLWVVSQSAPLVYRYIQAATQNDCRRTRKRFTTHHPLISARWSFAKSLLMAAFVSWYDSTCRCRGVALIGNRKQAHIAVGGTVTGGVGLTKRLFAGPVLPCFPLVHTCEVLMLSTSWA
jgi:hypothetical protein